MPWTTPSTVNAGDAILASLWNEQVRDNMASLVEAGTTLPSSPVDGQSYYYIADSTNGVVWHLRYRAASTKWEYVGGAPLTTSDLTERTKAAVATATWTNLGANDLTITAPIAGTYLATFTGTVVCTNVATFYVGFKVDTTAPTITSLSAKTTVNPAGAYPNIAVSYVVTTTGASKVIEVQYYQASAGSATIGRSGATLALTPIKIG